MGQVALQEPLRPLNTLAADIEAELALAYDAGIAHYTRAGELLNEAEQHFPNNRKGFFAWAERRFDRGPQQVKRYMGLANAIKKLENRSRPIKNPFENISEFERWRGTNPGGGNNLREKIIPILNKVDAKALAEENRRRADELAQVRKLAEQIIDIGFRALATKLHPDKKDGSRNAMQLLNAARERLRRAL